MKGRERDREYAMLLKTSGSFCLITLIMLFSLVSQGICAWDLWSVGYTRYDNVVVGTEDRGNVAATDIYGNVYVAGQREAPPYSENYFEHAVVKYDSSGTEQWAYRHGDSSFMPSWTVRDLVVDDDGNVYVAAKGNIIHVLGSDYRYDYHISKFDPQGNLLWEYHHGDPTHQNLPYDLDLDASGNVYVAGTVYEGSSSTNGLTYLLTIKLDPDGNLQWDTIHDPVSRPGAMERIFMKVDGAGSVHIGSHGLTTLKYDTYGNLLWETQYDPPGSPSTVQAIDVDGSGNVFLTGQSYSSEDSEYVTLKYDAEGTFLWATVHWPYPEQDGTVPSDMMLDSQGNVIVTGIGHLPGESEYKYVTIKYDSAGTELWKAGYDADLFDTRGSNLWIPVMVLDGDDNVILCGKKYVSEGITAVGVLVKYDAAGNELWESSLTVTLGDGYSSAGAPPPRHALAVDPSGHIVVGGMNRSYNGEYSYPEYGHDIGTVRYSPAGDLLWENHYGGTRSGPDQITDMAEGAEGNIIVTGTGGILALDEAGEILWSHPEVGLRLEIDADGNIYFGNSDAELFKLDPDGQVLWSRPDTGSIIKLSPDGYIYAATPVPSAGADESTLQTTKLDLEGNALWTDVYEGPVLGENNPQTIALDTEGNAFVVGKSAGDGTDLDIVTIKYGPLGTREWVVRYDGPAMGEDYPNAAEVDHGGNLLLTGASVGVGTDLDYVTIKYDTGGNLLWASRYNRTDMNGNDDSYLMAVDDDDCVYVAGNSQNGPSLLGELLPLYPREILTIKYDPDGTELWRAVCAGPLPTLSILGPVDMAMDDEANVYLIGYDIWDVTGLLGDEKNRVAILKYSSTGERIYLKEFNSLPTAAEARYNGKSIILHSNGKIIAGLYANPWDTSYDYMIVRMEEHWTNRIDWVPAATIGAEFKGSSDIVNSLFLLIVPIGAVIAMRILRRKK